VGEFTFEVALLRQRLTRFVLPAHLAERAVEPRAGLREFGFGHAPFGFHPGLVRRRPGQGQLGGAAGAFHVLGARGELGPPRFLGGEGLLARFDVRLQALERVGGIGGHAVGIAAIGFEPLLLPVEIGQPLLGGFELMAQRRHAVAVSAAVIASGSLIAATTYSVLQARAVARERDKAVDVQTFLLEMFGASGRDKADSVSVKQMLDAQASLLPTAYPDKPEMRAQMTATIAEGYDRLGLFALAEPLASQALEERRAMLAPTNPDIAVSTSLLGWIKFERGQQKEGEALLREAATLWEHVRPQYPRGLARTLNDLGVAVEASGKYAEADTLQRRTLALRRKLFGENDRATATTLSNLSAVLYRKGDLKGAVAMAESALVVMRAVMGPDHNRSTIVQNNLAAFAPRSAT